MSKDIEQVRTGPMLKEFLNRGWNLDYYETKEIDGMWYTFMTVFNGRGKVRLTFVNHLLMVYTDEPVGGKPLTVPCNPVGLGPGWFIDNIEKRKVEIVEV